MRPNIDGFIVQNQQTFQATGPRQLVPVIQGKLLYWMDLFFEVGFQYFNLAVETTDCNDQYFPSV